jgi:putative membrane protein
MIEYLPTLNAVLNTTSAVLLVTGYWFIRHGDREAHKRCMIATFAVSILFLTSYLTYHYQHGTTSFTGTGLIRPIYFIILGTHTVLAAAIVPLAIITLSRGLRNRIERHIPIARWTLPIWLYVSITGVVIYLLLYHAYPPSA